MSSFFCRLRILARFSFLLGPVLLATACTKVPPSGISDPKEELNRHSYNLNVAFDKALVSPLSDGYGNGIPQELRDRVSAFSRNLAEPGDVYNLVLQGRIKEALVGTGRFAVNSTAGMLGIVDVAAEFGVEGERTDFGETLYVWGFPEGNYEVMPFFGPSTTRDTIGFAVDLLVNPLTFLNYQSVSAIGIAAYLADGLNDRYTYSSVVDSILYDSSDGYAQARLLYLQNRRFELGVDAVEFTDDPYGDDSAGPYIDPYEDPYAE